MAEITSRYACVSGDGEFLAFGFFTAAEVWKENNAGTYEKIKSITASSGFFNCKFSAENTFFFLSAQNPEIYKYDGSTFVSHQNISLTASAGFLSRVVFRNPYFIYPEKNVDGDVNIKFFQHNPNTDLWEVAHQIAYPG